jgi:type I restriction enzyme, S subunit
MKSIIRDLADIKAAKRWDFSFHAPEHLRVLASLDSTYPVVRFGEIITVLTDMGAFSLYKTEFFVDEGVPFLRVQNIQEYGVDLEKDTKFISYEYHQQLERSRLRSGDLLLTTKAVIGISAVVNESLGECNISQNLVLIRLKDGINPNYVSVFLNSHLGRMQTETSATGTNQKYLNFERIYDLKITLPPRSLQDQIAQVMQKAYGDQQKKLEEATQSYQKILDYVLKELGINLASIQRKRNALVPISILQGGRFDFEAVVTLQDISSQFAEHETTLLKEIVDQTNERITPSIDFSDEIVNYIGLANIQSNTGELVKFEPVRGEEILSASPKFKKGDILFGRMRPYLNKVWIAEFDGVCSGEALVFRPNTTKVNTQFLHALLLSKITLDQVVPLQSGSSLPRVSSSDVLSIKLPIPKDLQKQKTIGYEVEKRRNEVKRLRSQADAVVTAAKARVERMILGEDTMD